MERSKHLKTYVGLSALFVAGSAAFFSVFGLSNLFAGAKLSVIVMASSLEFGKLVAASFLYRFWNNVNKILRTYMAIGVVVLVLITSAGIFGYLSNAYQGATINFEKQSTELLALEDRLDVLQEDRVFLKQELDDQVATLPENYFTAKRNLREQYNPQIQEISTEILEVKGRISDLEIELIETGVDVGPAIYLAKAFETDVDTVVKFFIFILIFVFDPLALALVLAFNHTLIHDEKEKDNVEKMYDMYTKKKKNKVFKRDEEKEIVDTNEPKSKDGRKIT
jgi:hypothetical protein